MFPGSILHAQIFLAVKHGGAGIRSNCFSRSRNVADARLFVAVLDAGTYLVVLHARWSASWKSGGVVRLPHRFWVKVLSRYSNILDTAA